MNINKITRPINTVLIMTAVGAFFMGPAYGETSAQLTAAFKKCLTKADGSRSRREQCLKKCEASRGHEMSMAECSKPAMPHR